MGDSYLAVKVQTIGVIDAILTASLLAALIFQDGVVLWDNIGTTFDTDLSGTSRTVQPNFKKIVASLLASSNNTNETNYSVWTWTSSSTTTENDKPNPDLRFWWRIFHDLVIGFGLGLTIGAALALIRSTSLEIAPKKAIKLVRVWMGGNILIVLITAMAMTSMVLTRMDDHVTNFCVWTLFYLTVRIFCIYIVRGYLWDLNKRIDPLITADDDENEKKTQEEA